MQTCQLCGQRNAQIDITGIVNGQETSLRICMECAEENGISPDSLDAVSLAEFLERCLNLNESGSGRADIESALLDVECPQCGISRGEIEDTGLLGCAFCYSTFNRLVNRRLQTSPSSPDHRGKQKQQQTRESIPRLRRQLRDAVNREDYEEAAELRDQIQELERAKAESS